MPDVVVTVPKNFTWTGAPGKRGLAAWLAEGDAAGSEWSGTRYGFTCSGRPTISPGERVYVVCEGRLIGYAPLIRVEFVGRTGCRLIRGGGAVACTLDAPIIGFRGFRYRWWDRKEERAIV